jgi:signal transduction histidine kinase
MGVTRRETRVLVLAFTEQETRLICTVLKRAGIIYEVCSSTDEIGLALQEGAGAALIASEALSASHIQRLVKVLNLQPSWSAFPFLIFTGSGALTRAGVQQLELIDRLQNVTLLEWPLPPITLVSAVRAALRFRQRQYEIRDQLAERLRVEEELRHSNEDLQQFAYVASHDLQEPLRQVTSYMQLLARRYRGKLDAEADEFINYAVNGAKRLQQLIRDLLAYSRAGQQVQAGTAVDCKEVLQQALKGLQLTIRETRAEITYDPLPKIWVDGRQLGQVLQNLLSNALKFRGQEPPRIHISARQEGNEWIFAVRDNGIGIEPQFAGRIFIIFQRLHDQAEYPGTGIGLAICKKIVERQGGRIWVESELGKGATFFFTIPMSETKTHLTKG